MFKKLIQSCQTHRPYFVNYLFAALWLFTLGIGSVRYAGLGSTLDCDLTVGQCQLQYLPAWGQATQITIATSDIKAVKIQSGAKLPGLPTFSQVQIQTAQGSLPLTEFMSPQTQVPTQVMLQAHLKPGAKPLHWRSEQLPILRSFGQMSIGLAALVLLSGIGLVWLSHRSAQFRQSSQR